LIGKLHWEIIYFMLTLFEALLNLTTT